jgi:ABC-type multidrug transport system permease subunit
MLVQLLDSLRHAFAGFYPVMMKEWIEIFKDRFTLGIMLTIPVVQIIIYGYGVTFEVRNVDTLILNEDREHESQKLIDKLVATQYFRIAGFESSRRALEREIISGRARVGIIIPPDFSDKIEMGLPAQAQVLIDGSDSVIANAIHSTTVAVGLNRAVELLTTSPADKRAALPLELRPRMLFNPDARTTNFMLPGVVAYLGFMITLFLTVNSIVREREAGTLDQLLVTPVEPLGLMLGKLCPYLVIAFITVNTLLAAMCFVFSVPIHGNFLLLELCNVIFVFVALSMGLLISALSKHLSQAIQMAVFTIVPTILLSGFVFPRESMPIILNWVGNLIPLTHFLQIQRGIVLRGAGLTDLWQPIVVLIAFGVLFIYFSVRRFQSAQA